MVYQNVSTLNMNNYKDIVRNKIAMSFQRLHKSNVYTAKQNIQNKDTIKDDVFKEKMHSVMLEDPCFKEVYTKPSSNPKVLKIEEELKGMGVNANFFDDLSVAKVTLSTLKKVKQKGFSLPEEIFMMNPTVENTQGYTFCIKIPEKEKMSPVFIKKGMADNYKTHPSKEALREVGLRPLTVDSPEGVILHEMGHYLHNLNGYNKQENEKIWNNVINSENRYYLAKEVSTYAFDGDKSGCDFVAEVFAGMMNGEKYSPAVMDIYNALHGPAFN